MKKQYKTIIMVFVVMIALLAPAATALQGPRIRVSVLRYEPTPAEQGNTVDVWLQVRNTGTEAEDIALRFEKEYPFSLPEGQQERIDIEHLVATEEKVVKFTLLVAPDASNGERNAKFWYHFATDEKAWILLETPLLLQTQNAGLVIDAYEVQPTPLLPGQTATIRMTLRNAGTISAKNVDVMLDLDESPFTTVSTGTKKRIAYIDAGKSVNVSFEIAAATTTEVNLYTIPVSFTYQDTRNKVYNDAAKISIMVNAEPDVIVMVDSTQAKKKTGPATVSLKVVNKGIAGLKYVSLHLLPGKGYDLLSPSNEAYMGNIDSDDFETVDFKLRVTSKEPVLNLSVEFRDPYNKEFRHDTALPLLLVTDRELGKTSSPFGLLAVLAAAIGATWWYFTKKRGKR